MAGDEGERDDDEFSLFGPPPVRRSKNGRFRIDLSDDERSALKEIAETLTEQVRAPQDDRSLFRLFPPGYSEDLLRQVEYDGLMRDDLQTSHISALQTLAETAGATDVDEEQLTAWMKALNQVRLVLGTRLGVTDDMDMDGVAGDDPTAGAWALYAYLGELQSYAIEALSETIDPAGRPGADDDAPS